jgi:uncharacterized protein
MDLTPHLGAPCWFELSSTNVDQSIAFYESLWGWTRESMDMGPIGLYHFLANAKGTIGAAWTMPADQQAAGVPSHWAVYFWAPDCDALTAKAKALGGQVLVEPMNAGEFGRMSVIQDPTGATFCLWQSTASDGGGNFVMNEDHSVCWVELATRDVPAARQFYGELLGWQFSESPIPGFDGLNYTEAAVNGTPMGGMMPMTPEWGDMPAHWAIYIQVPDVDATAKAAASLGGAVCVQPFDAPGVGRIAMINEPSGAGTYIIKRATRA